MIKALFLPRIIPILISLLLLPFCSNSQTYPDMVISGTDTIPLGITRVNSLEIPKDAHLVVEGTLEVMGNFTMTHNNAQFTMKDGAAVIIKGNFTASNLVVISVSSYLIVHGNFSKDGASNQGDIIVEGGNIYIFGEVENWDEEFETCENYAGDTGAVAQEECDYGTGDDFKNNHETLPPELIDLVNCFDLSDIEDAEACIGQSASFSVAEDETAKFQWQKRNSDGTWVDLPELLPTLNIPRVTEAMTGNQYRVVATPKDPLNTCSISVSRAVSLNVKSEFVWTGNINNDWTEPRNWSCGSLPHINTDVRIPSGLVNYPILHSGDFGAAKNLIFEVGAGLVLNGTLELANSINNSEPIDARNGTLVYKGTLPQSINPGTFTENKIANLTINNSENVTLQGSLLISGTVTALKGNLLSNGHLTLLSDASRTAMISGNGSGEVLGTVTMQRYLDPAFGYKYLSSPFSNSTVADFQSQIVMVDPSNQFPHFYRYNENREDGTGNDATGWEAYTDVSKPLNILEGYAVNFGEETVAKIVSLSGTVNNGPQTRSLTNNNGFFTKGFHLTGNPYPSPIDWESSTGWTKTNIDDAIYFFSASSTDPYTGTYSSYIPGGPSTDGKASNIISSMQGFFVRVSSTATQGMLAIDNTARIDNFSQPFVKTALPGKISLIRLRAGFENENISDPMVVYYNQLASSSFEKDLDAMKLMNTQVNVPNLYSLTPENEKLSIHAIPKPANKDRIRIPLGIRVEKAGNLILELADIEKEPSAAEYYYLIDREQNRSQQLDNSRRYATYVTKGEYNSRFELLISKGPVTDPVYVLGQDFSVRSTSGKVMIKLSVRDGVEGEITVSSLSGQVLQTLQGENDEELEIRGIKSAGVYIISMEAEGFRTSKKVLIE